MEIDSDVEREEVEGLLRELMDGKMGKQMKEKAMELKQRAERATKQGGSSYINFHMLVQNLKEES